MALPETLNIISHANKKRIGRDGREQERLKVAIIFFWHSNLKKNLRITYCEHVFRKMRYKSI
jgi:hypothetical protein